MAVTQSQTNSHVRNVAVGRYITSSTAAAIALTIGFKARYIKVTNNTSGDSFEWFEGMAAASATKVTGSTGAVSLVTSDGITVSANGFTIGLDTDVNVINEQLSWVAIG